MKKGTRNRMLALGALGVVFGDIGTSPLYAMSAVFGVNQQRMAINEANILGILSLIIWSITIVVAIKYLMFVMRADNRGEGGIIALIGLIKHSRISKPVVSFSIVLGLVGVALFYGDSLITPAISVLSAVEGVKVITPSFSHLVMPVTLAILTFLFWVQKYGTGSISKFFGPIMLVWFTVIGLAGLWHISQTPSVLHALSPVVGFQFFVQHLKLAFIAMGAITLTITGAEALYADMGHFGRKPISRAWFYVVFPALICCYLGQGALLLGNPQTINNPTLLMFPEFLRVPFIMLATIATLIASQSVISGAFSLTRQAVHLDFLPKMLVRHTSARETGQIYLPLVNLILFVGVVLLVLIFGSSVQLAHAFGMAVSITLAMDSVLFIIVMRTIWHKSLLYCAIIIPVLLAVDLIFVSSNSIKLFEGAWFPLSIAAGVLIVITTWMKGRRIINRERTLREGSLRSYVDRIRTMSIPVNRVPGQAVYIGHHEDLAPLALHATVEQLQELHEKAVIVSIRVRNVAHVPKEERADFDNLGHVEDGISHLTLNYGYFDPIDIPKAMAKLRNLSSELDFDPEQAAYFISLAKIVPTKRRNMARWRKTLFCLMSNYSASSGDYFKLPIEHTIEMRSLLKL